MLKKNKVMDPKVLEELLKRVTQLLDEICGQTTYGDKIITASGNVGTYENGHARAAFVLSDTTFNHFFVNEIDVVVQKGYNVLIPSQTSINPGAGNFITGFEIVDGGQVQVWE